MCVYLYLQRYPSDFEQVGGLRGKPKLNEHMPGMSFSNISSAILSIRSKALFCFSLSNAFLANRVISSVTSMGISSIDDSGAAEIIGTTAIGHLDLMYVCVIFKV